MSRFDKVTNIGRRDFENEMALIRFRNMTIIVKVVLVAMPLQTLANMTKDEEHILSLTSISHTVAHTH